MLTPLPPKKTRISRENTDFKKNTDFWKTLISRKMWDSRKNMDILENKHRFSGKAQSGISFHFGSRGWASRSPEPPRGGEPQKLPPKFVSGVCDKQNAPPFFSRTCWSRAPRGGKAYFQMRRGGAPPLGTTQTKTLPLLPYLHRRAGAASDAMLCSIGRTEL